jgi:SAM-dependent methyltransferase
VTGWQSRQRARYDEFADWYIPWVGQSPGLICDPSNGLMPVHLGGERWLDVACGAGRTSRELGRRGASVVGVDISPELISRARASESAQSLDIRYLVADVTRPAEWWDGQPFDGAVCEMAFMDIDNLDGTVAVVAQVLRPGGRFLASLVNPCFPGNDVGLSSWPPNEGYEAEGFWTSPDHDPDGVRIRVGSNHRKLSTYLNLLIDTGLHLERVVEPAAPLPTWLVLACRRNGQAKPAPATLALTF